MERSVSINKGAHLADDDGGTRGWEAYRGARLSLPNRRRERFTNEPVEQQFDAQMLALKTTFEAVRLWCGSAPAASLPPGNGVAALDIVDSLMS
jgi:hypothetical protein